MFPAHEGTFIPPQQDNTPELSFHNFCKLNNNKTINSGITLALLQLKLIKEEKMKNNMLDQIKGFNCCGEEGGEGVGTT